MTVPEQVLAAVRSIPHPRQEPDMTTIDKTGASDAEFQARIAPFAAVPDPRFRDQLAEQAWGVLVAAADRELVPLHGANSWNVVAHAIVGNQLPVIAAEVEARVQAAANQRAAEELRSAAKAWQWGAWADAPRHADRIADRIGAAQYVTDWLRDRAAALAPAASEEP